MNNPHSNKAFFDNQDDHNNKTLQAFRAIARSRGNGINATELSKILGVPEHRSCASALSRAKKKYFGVIVYRKQAGETHGRYYHSNFVPKEEV